ncbi:cell wall protein [Cordyceps fumosorosea ARSEF 2679]|uniref:Cell wall protein n=1 Tax=Cordyceps fumosorosea (strain ARSEF 2679) TaxID=1081104 RepID=A0A167LZX4_CORFA|nr:cell wall protein [Cordyceps fumosorosea ARSEF 2679]OAA53741.1 cell wall protein [Cordyceps fumosorosea ARSEF 2679]
MQQQPAPARELFTSSCRAATPPLVKMKLSLILHFATSALAFTVPLLAPREADDNGTATTSLLAPRDDMDGTAIQSLLLDIRHFTNDLTESFKKYKGNQSALYYNSTMLLRTLREGLPLVQAHPELALRDALRLITPVKSLAKGGRQLRRAALLRRLRVRREHACETVREYVVDIHDAGMLLKDAVIEKLPAGVVRVLAPYLAVGVTRNLVDSVVDFSKDKCKNVGWRKIRPPPMTPDPRTSSSAPTAGGPTTTENLASTTGSSSTKVTTSTVSAPLPPTTTTSSKTASRSTTDVELVDSSTTASPSTSASPSTTAAPSTTASPSTTDVEVLDNVD